MSVLILEKELYNFIWKKWGNNIDNLEFQVHDNRKEFREEVFEAFSKDNFIFGSNKEIYRAIDLAIQLIDFQITAYYIDSNLK